MSIDLKIPEMGESITQVVIGEWLKGEADYVERDEDVVLVESDKATVEIPAPESGKLVKIFKQNGETAAVGEIIGRLESAEWEASETSAAPSNQEGRRTEREKPPSAESQAPETGTEQAAAREARESDQEQTIEEAVTEQSEAIQRTPVIESRAEKTVSKAEGRRFQETTPHAGTTAPRRPSGDEQARDQASWKIELEGTAAQPAARESAREEKVVPMSPIRRRIADRLVQAQQTTAFLSTFNEIEMSAVNAIRRQYHDDFQKKHGIKLGLMGFFVKASIAALRMIPQVNAEIRGTDIIQRNYYDIGVAVGGGKGLVVPVLRNAQKLSFAEIEWAIQEFAQKAERNQLTPDDLAGGTFTISNGGIYGSLLSTPILNAPQSGILGMHAIQERPVARDGQVVIRPMMYVALTYDHRIVDGREAVTFLKRIKECVEAPSRMLLDV